MEEIICRKCGAHADAGETFCGGCGAFLEWEGEHVVVEPVPPSASLGDSARPLSWRPRRCFATPSHRQLLRTLLPRLGPAAVPPPPCPTAANRATGLLPQNKAPLRCNRRCRLSGQNPRRPASPRRAEPLQATFTVVSAVSQTARTGASAAAVAPFWRSPCCPRRGCPGGKGSSTGRERQRELQGPGTQQPRRGLRGRRAEAAPGLKQVPAHRPRPRPKQAHPSHLASRPRLTTRPTRSHPAPHTLSPGPAQRVCRGRQGYRPRPTS